jgi:2-C-methyl-D-erythritol 4-phosphate cytidylyltransferase/2-C-methyl-D-erythritol 2,4-cyclodiphosphate synthase
LSGGRRSAVPWFDAVVVAAGTSRRMAGLDKLDAPLAGRPLLAWTLAAFGAVPEVERIVLVSDAARAARLRDAGWLPPTVVAVVPGGPRRQQSVAAGVARLWELSGPVATTKGAASGDGERVVLVHDGARPVASPALIRRVAAAAGRYGAAIPVVPVAETLKRIRPVDGVRGGSGEPDEAGDLGEVAGTVDREGLALAQTPQGFRRSVLESAYALHPPDGDEEWTDEAALLEACTIPVHAVAGEPENLKVTLPKDLRHAEAALALGLVHRVGFGSDGHAFGPGRPLALGGIQIADAPRLAGHSDGDVVLHAIADALLGAAGLGDLGRQFPADASTPDGIVSSRLLSAVVERLAEGGLRPRSIDVTILGARPRLGGRLEEMRAAISGLVGLAPEWVSVKASTGNLAGVEGAGRGISADAVAVVESVR